LLLFSVLYSACFNNVAGGVGKEKFWGERTANETEIEVIGVQALAEFKNACP
jgi:hypothetical protein